MLNSLWDEKAYVPLSTDEENESQHSSNDKAFLNGSLCNSRSKWRAVLGVLTISLAINTLALFLFIQHLHNEIHPSGSSAFSSFGKSMSFQKPKTSLILLAGLSYNVSKRIDWTTKYSNGTDAELDELWLNEDPSQHGIVALDNSYAAAQRLHQGVPFFWKEDAGVYVVSAYHQLHCLVGRHLRHTIDFGL